MRRTTFTTLHVHLHGSAGLRVAAAIARAIEQGANVEFDPTTPGNGRRARQRHGLAPQVGAAGGGGATWKATTLPAAGEPSHLEDVVKAGMLEAIALGAMGDGTSDATFNFDNLEVESALLTNVFIETRQGYWEPHLEIVPPYWHPRDAAALNAVIRWAVTQPGVPLRQLIADAYNDDVELPGDAATMPPIKSVKLPRQHAQLGAVAGGARRARLKMTAGGKTPSWSGTKSLDIGQLVWRWRWVGWDSSELLLPRLKDPQWDLYYTTAISSLLEIAGMSPSIGEDQIPQVVFARAEAVLVAQAA